MALGQTAQDWWRTVLEFLKFLARVPIALLILLGAGAVAFLVVGFIFRSTQWVWTHLLSRPW